MADQFEAMMERMGANAHAVMVGVGRSVGMSGREIEWVLWDTSRHVRIDGAPLSSAAYVTLVDGLFAACAIACASGREKF